MTVAWPDGWPRTDANRRKRGAFNGGKKFEGYGTRELTISAAFTRVQDEVRRFRGSGLRVDTDLRVRKDGQPYSDQRQPDDPGCVVSFRLPGDKPVVLPCDKYDRVEQNLAAVAATLEAKRAVERHGVSTLDREFEGYAALPSGDAAFDAEAQLGMAARSRPPADPAFDPWAELEVAPGAALAVCEAAYKAAAIARHPDRPGGDAASMERANRAIAIIRGGKA